MKKVILAAALLTATAAAGASEAPLWLRNPAISPDGRTIAFTYRGDIFTVATSGGQARQITTNPAYDTAPIWSPDGQTIAFASDRDGSMDVYTVAATGGQPVKLTTHSAAETPVAFLTPDTLLFTAAVMPAQTDIQFPSSLFPQTYKVSVKGGRPQMYTSLAMEQISVNPVDGSILYTDKKGYEDPLRKHHTSSIARDIWRADHSGRTGFRKLTAAKGEDRNAVWAPDGRAYYFLSERDGGSFNVYKTAPGSSEVRQITRHAKHPVRSLSASADGTLCYSYDGELWTVKEGAEPRKVSVAIAADYNEKPLSAQVRRSGATDLAVSPSGKEVAFILHGDVYVTSIEYATTRRITDTPQQERDLSFSADGRSLVYSAERGDTWGIYRSSIKRPEEKLFTYATEIEEEPLVADGRTSFQPSYSPDGKEVAFLRDRTELCVINLADRKVRTVLDGKYNYSYSDGDVTYRWSPDSRWFLVDYIGHGGWNNKDVALVKADGSGEVTNLTESGYTDGNAKWVLDGKAMIWESDRAGYRSHGSWGAESDTYIMFFDPEAWDRFRLSKEELALLEEVEKDAKDKNADDSKADKKDKKDKKGKDKDAKKGDDAAVKPLKFELDGRRDRVARLTGNSSRLGDAHLSKKGDKLYYCAAFEDGYDLWERDLKEGSVRKLAKGVGGFMNPGKDENKVYVVRRGGLTEVSLTDGKTKDIAFAADFNYRPADERRYIFNHAWRQVNDKFYDPQIHGIDWNGYHDSYARFLDHIDNNYDFAQMLSEMLGELNGSHTGARYYGGGSAPATASLGAFFDETYAGVGREVLPGTVPPHGKRQEQTVKPISAGRLSDLLYNRWVERNREATARLSGGKIGYIHVKGMDSPSFRTVYSDLLGRYRDCDAVVIDTRHNGGGWLHDDLATLLSGKQYAEFAPRGQYIGSDPFNKWLKPSCVLGCEDNYSNAHGFPWVYKTLGIGKLVGTPVPGTMTAVWWESQIDPSIVFGIPQVGCKDMQGRYLENQELQPDILIYNTPEQQLSGDDRQLEAAVKSLMTK